MSTPVGATLELFQFERFRATGYRLPATGYQLLYISLISPSTVKLLNMSFVYKPVTVVVAAQIAKKLV